MHDLLSPEQQAEVVTAVHVTARKPAAWPGRAPRLSVHGPGSIASRTRQLGLNTPLSPSGNRLAARTCPTID